jgi:hypothetical protein
MKTKYLVIWFLLVSYSAQAKDKGESPYFDIISDIDGFSMVSHSASGGDSVGYGTPDPLIVSCCMRLPIYIGAVLGVNFFNPDNKFEYQNRELLSGELPALRGRTLQIGLTYVGYLGRDMASSRLNHSITFSYNLNILWESKKIINPAMNSRLLNFNGNDADSLTTSLEHDNKTEFDLIGLDWMWSYLLIENLSVNLELGFHLAIKNKINESLKIFDSQNQTKFKTIENTQLENDNKKLILINGDIPNINSFQMPFSIGLNYDAFHAESTFRYNYNIGTNLFNFQKDINNDYLFHRVRLYWIYAI